ncbi:S9 family peptidase [Wenyingzhuangia marina]|uniref:Dipeptidyl-peptidase-4 n=1 Tax=Wenyingzhuangia marina TaxID=1195760 RepID=A0A1M5TDE4_9FLAO|nr:S9 family peptidase [Wenyingzhuangia marina]GGF66373.1 peptidase S9 [Wenyingzhuangia marina]SHH48752.1 dipeptidyl-peptidase-4 [Wenyingzhuangia marina]
MNKSNLIFFIVSLYTVITVSQKKDITLNDIWSGEFRTKSIDEIRWLNNDKEYTVLNWDPITKSSTVDLYDYNSNIKKKTIVRSSFLNIKPFSDYSFNKNEDKLVLTTEMESIYRRSSLAKYYIYDLNTLESTLVDDRKIQEPTFSPSGDALAYVCENNIYIKNLNTNVTIQITSDGEKNKIINGITDWVYEEEFEFVRAFEWNKTGTQLAYIKFDETNVPEFSMDVYGQDLYPKQQVFKYPKAGENNSIVSLYNYHISSKETSKINFPESPYYIPRIKFTEKENVLSVQTLNRHQNNLNLYFCDVEKNQVNLVLNEKDDAYIDITNNLTFLNDNSFLWTSEKDGYNHIYHYSKSVALKKQITKGNWEVTDFYGYNSKNETLYYQSTENGNINRNVYAINLKGKNKIRLTKKTGTNSATFSAGYTYFINKFSNATTPYIYTLNNTSKAEQIKELINNNQLLRKLESYHISNKEFSTINVNGNDLNMWMLKPVDFNEQKQYPVLMYQYSGPGSQEVVNRWHSANDYWYQLLAAKGYIIVCVDGRGTGFKGADFKKVTYKELGKYEVEDQIQAAKQLGMLSYVDKNRIGIWGWSFGGFMSSNCILKGNDIFKMAIAVAPVTSWRFYDTIYTERYMQTPQENPTGYDLNSPLNYADQLKGKFLLVHGSADDNVHVQNSMRLINQLVNHNKQFDWAIYPDKNHGIYGGNTRLQLYTKMTNFIEQSL